MSRRTEKRERTVVDEVTVEIKCDWCGALAPNPQSYDQPWSEGTFDIIKPAVSMKRGASYPDNGHSVTEYFEICPECYLTKVVPWMESQGLVQRTHEVDW